MNNTHLIDEVDHPEREPESLRAVIMESYEKCSFCGSKLVFSHDLNIGFLQVVEVARCPGCGVTMNPKKFTLQ